MLEVKTSYLTDVVASHYEVPNGLGGAILTGESMYELIRQETESGRTVATATIVRTRGSTPRETGAKMLIGAGGQLAGTIGGGCGEADAWRAALSVIESGRPEIVLADLTEEIDLKSEGVCGGIMEIFVESWSEGLFAEEIGRLGNAGSRFAIATVVESRGLADKPGAKLLATAEDVVRGGFSDPDLQRSTLELMRKAISEGRTRTFEVDLPGNGRMPRKSAEVYVEVFLPPPTALIVGAGHIALPLAKICKLAGFRVAILDDRPSFANWERFPDADEVIAAGFEETLAEYPLTPDTYVVLITRGHQYDVYSLRKVINEPVKYIGMIGSKRRVWAVFKLLHDEGVPLDKLARIYAPIGIDVKTETPAEIAVIIAAEMIKIMHGGDAKSLSDDIRGRYLRLLAEGKELG